MKLNLSIKFFQKKSTSTVLIRGEHEYMNPVRHWMYGLSAAVLTLCGGIGFIAYDFYDQLGTNEIDFVPSTQATMYRDKEVIQMSERYVLKETTFTTLREQTKAPVVVIQEPEKPIETVEPETPVTEEEVPLAETLIEQ